MFKALIAALRSTKAPHALYGTVVAQARNPVFFSQMGVPDTLNGRFEMMCLHIYAIMRRLKLEGAQYADFSQNLFDIFLDDMDAGLREAGVGDTTVPKRIQKMSRIFYGRAKALEEIDFSDPDLAAKLQTILSRNLHPDSDAAPSMTALAVYMEALWRKLEQTDADDVCAASFSYPDPEEFINVG